MSFVISALAFMVLLTLLILVHELGHYGLARLFDVDVEEFGFGLPPKILTMFRYHRTDFTLNWIPFGGFVRLKGENAMDEGERTTKGSFASASVLQRSAILLGGVAMNFLLAIILLTIGFSIGRWVPSWYMSLDDLSIAETNGELSMKQAVSIGLVTPGSPAEQAGIRTGAVIEAVDGTNVVRPDDVVALQKGKRRVTYTMRDSVTATETHDVSVTLKDGKAGIEITALAYDVIGPVRPLSVAAGMALKESWFMTQQTVMGLGTLVRSLASQHRVPEGITGIVGIAVLTHDSLQHGFMSYLRLVALLSLSLAILNVLPLPALDGGRLLFVIIEGIIRRPMNRRFELVTNAIGFFLIIGLIVVITFNDLAQIFLS
jgi:regulator of sigma E protease